MNQIGNRHKIKMALAKFDRLLKGALDNPIGTS